MAYLGIVIVYTKYADISLAKQLSTRRNKNWQDVENVNTEEQKLANAEKDGKGDSHER